MTLAAYSCTSLVKADGIDLRGSVDNGAVYLKSNHVVNATPMPTPEEEEEEEKEEQEEEEEEEEQEDHFDHARSK